MASFLSKFFKPKWQHASKEVRLEAIKAFDQSSVEHQEILLQLLLNDKEQVVKETALSLIVDPNTLIAHYQSLPESLRSAALKRISELCQQLGLSLFDMVEDTQLLAQMILSSDEQSEFMNGLARLQNEKALLLIAQQAQLSKIRQAATELIETEEHLSALAESAKSGDKKVFQMAKSKLLAIRDRQKQELVLHEKVNSLLSSMEELRNTEDSTLYAAKLDNLEQRWNELTSAANAEEIARYQSLLMDCKEKRSSFKASTPSETTNSGTQDANTRDQSDTTSELQATLATLRDSLDQLKSKAASAQDVAAIDAIIKTQETRWLESAKTEEISKVDEKTYLTLMGQLRSYLSALRKLSQNEVSLSQLTQGGSESAPIAEEKSLRALLTTIAWPESFEAPELIKQAQASLEKSKENKQLNNEHQRALSDEFNASLLELDKALDDKLLADSKKLMQASRKIYNQLDKKHQHQFSAAIKLRSNQLEELRDWQGFAASPRQLQLCEEMEQLVEQHISPQDKADKIKALQNEWKSLGGSRDQQVWERFSKAADLAFEPCASYFNEQGQLKQANLSKRKTLLNQLSDFIAQNDWSNTDWKGVEKINRQARNEWRDAYPVDHKAGRKLQQRFNDVLVQLDEKLEVERAENIKQKEEVVSRAEQLAAQLINKGESENSSETITLQTAMNEAKNLQREWQAIGITEHKKDRALWKAFRKACDQIFELRDNERKQAKEEQSQKIDAANAALVAAKLLAEQDFSSITDLDSALQQVRATTKLFNELSGKAKSRLIDEQARLIEHLKTQRKALLFGEIQKQWSEAARKADLLSTLSSVVSKSSDDEKIGVLKEEFISKVKLSKATEESFQSSWVKLSAGKGIETLSSEQTQELCIRCEIAAGLESPAEDQERRMQLQVSRLSEGLSENAHLTREEQLEQLLNTWFASVLIDNKLRSSYQSRIDASIKKVFAPNKANKQEATATTENA